MVYSSGVEGGQGAVTVRSTFLPTSEANAGGSDFKTLMGRLYRKPYDLMDQYINPDLEVINIEGIGEVDKNSPASSMAAAFFLSEVQIELETAMNYLNFIYKTLPQMIEKSL